MENNEFKRKNKIPTQKKAQELDSNKSESKCIS